jgi:4-hydroxybenzoate polyprenyltransferase
MLLPLLRSLRPAQWPKNLFVLAPLVFSRGLLHPDQLAAGLAAFGLFCAGSSTVYLLNDIADRDEDRHHPLKRHRPVASGALPVVVALAAALLLAVVAVAGALALGSPFATFLGAYLALNLAYTWGFKRVVILDVMTLSLGFVLRVLAGGAAVRVAVSSWLVLCTIFLALFLAFSKRRHELFLLAERATEQRAVLEQYSPAFLDQMINVVTASTVIAYALYAIAPETAEKYDTHDLVYTLPLVLFGIFRYLYLVYQRPERKNPTEAILTDLPSLLNFGIWAAAVLWIVYGR